MNETEQLEAFLGNLYHKTTSIDKFFLRVQSGRKTEKTQLLNQKIVHYIIWKNDNMTQFSGLRVE